MELSKEIKDLIKQEYIAFEEFMYAGKTKAERDELAQFFTPPEISFLLLKNYNVDSLEDKIIRDPTCGSGNLLAACIIAGADPNNIFGNELDMTMVNTCRERLVNTCINYRKDLKYSKEELIKLFAWHIHEGNATNQHDLEEFDPDYKPYQEPKQVSLWDL